MNEKFPVKIEAKKEFLYKEGVVEVINEIKKLLCQKDHIVISISGGVGVEGGYNDTDVGKTTLGKDLSQELDSLGANVILTSNINSLISNSSLILYYKKNKKKLKMVVIFDDEPNLPVSGESREDFNKYRNLKLEKGAKSVKLDLNKFDIDILIYRPDRPASKDEIEVADIVIKNEKAVDKKRI